MSSSSSSGSSRKPIRQLIRELNQHFDEISKFNDRVTRLEEAFGRVEKKVTDLEHEMGQVEECLVRLVTDHNQLVKLLQPPELQRYPADLMPREVRTDAEGKVLESKLITEFKDDPVGTTGAGVHDTSKLDTIDEQREEAERAVHTLTAEVPEPRPTSPVEEWSVGTTPQDVLARRLAELDTMRPKSPDVNDTCDTLTADVPDPRPETPVEYSVGTTPANALAEEELNTMRPDGCPVPGVCSTCRLNKDDDIHHGCSD